MEQEAVLEGVGIDNGFFDMLGFKLDENGGGERMKLIFMGNKPRLRWNKNPELYFLMIPRESSLSGWTQPDIAVYFSINERGLLVYPWAEAKAEVVKKGKDSMIKVRDCEENKETVIPFSTREGFKMAVYSGTMLDDIFDYSLYLGKGKKSVVRHINKLYGRLRGDFDYALDSTRARWNFSNALYPVHKIFPIKYPELSGMAVGFAGGSSLLAAMSYLTDNQRSLLVLLGAFGAASIGTGLGLTVNNYFNRKNREREMEGLVEKIEED